MSEVAITFNEMKSAEVSRISASSYKVVQGTYKQWRTQEFCSRWEEGSTNSAEDRGQRERGSGSGSPLVRGSGGSCNLVQEISFHIVKFS